MFFIIKRKSFKNVSINVEVNSHLLKAFVDSGAQSTISKFFFSFPRLSFTPTPVSPEAAEACGFVSISIPNLYLKFTAFYLSV